MNILPILWLRIRSFMLQQAAGNSNLNCDDEFENGDTLGGYGIFAKPAVTKCWSNEKAFLITYCFITAKLTASV